MMPKRRQKCKVTPVQDGDKWFLQDERGGTVVDAERMRRAFLFCLPTKWFDSREDAIAYAVKNNYQL